MIKLKNILNEETILVRRVDGDGAEKFLKKYPKVKQIMTTLAQKNTDLMRGYKAFLKFKDKQEDYLGGRAEQTTSATFGSKTFYKYDWNNLKGHWPEVYQYIYTLRYGGLDGAKVESINEASEVKFKELKPIQQKQVVAFQKVIGGDHSQIFAGIHGMVVDIPARGNFGTGYRFGADTLKKLLALKIRWVEADGDVISIGF